MCALKRKHCVSELQSPHVLRRSKRLKQSKGEAHIAKKATSPVQLPSPSLTGPDEIFRGLKRKQPASTDTQVNQKKPRIEQSTCSQPEGVQSDPIAYWAAHKHWPQDFWQTRSGMNAEDTKKRKSESSHRSHLIREMAHNGIFMKDAGKMKRESENLCSTLLEGNLKPLVYVVPPEQISKLLERVDPLNEARVQRDITPWVVPSAEHLAYRGVPNMGYVADEVQAEWIRCTTMGITRPKPDFTVGLFQGAFNQDEIEKLQNYSSSERPVLFTPNLCFPFLICEVKNGEEGLNKAHRQNIHSASIAIKAIFELYTAAFRESDPARVKSLHGKVLVFTVSHDTSLAKLFGHYAVLSARSPQKLLYYRTELAVFGFNTRLGAERYNTYNFVRNVYDTFAPDHLKRIQDAVAFLPTPKERTGLSFATSDLGLSESTSQQTSHDAGEVRREIHLQTSAEPASAAQREEMARIFGENKGLLQQMERQRAENKEREEKMEKQIDRLLQQMERQQAESKEKEEKTEKQMERQRAESKDKEEKMRAESKEQMEQIMSLLKQPGK